MPERACWICLEPAGNGDIYHRACLRRLFGSPKPPEVDLDLARLQTVALATVGKTTISGVQRKLSLGLSADKSTLRGEIAGGAFLLKPQSELNPHLPELELLSMRLAGLAGVPVPPCGLVRLRDDSPAYVIRRFDRPESGGKVRVEDFCQLAELPPKDKYTGSAELCFRLVKRYTSEPLIEALKLYRQLLVAWWLGNGDLHLKNLSVLVDSDRLVRLTPAYDMLATRMVIPHDQLALPVGGKRDGLTAEHWLRLAEYAGIPVKAARRVLRELGNRQPGAADLIRRAPVPEPTADSLIRLLQERTDQLQM